ncbi:MAG: outer membrane protein assembly factor, partial [Planctomycetota bacterium]
MMAELRFAGLLLILLMTGKGASARQDVPEQDVSAIDQAAPQTIREVRIEGLSKIDSMAVKNKLLTRKGEKLVPRKVREDLGYLWKQHKIRVLEVHTEPVEDGVRVIFRVKEFPRFEKIAFRGLNHLSQERVRVLLDLTEGESLDELTAQALAQKLREFYEKDGYVFFSIDIVTDPEEGTLTFRIDEGPDVRVRSIEFIGNKTFPRSAWLNLSLNLLDAIKSQPGFFSNAPFSYDVLEDDLASLRSFYRGRGYLDAIVELKDLKFSDDNSGVDITISIWEGPVYRVAGVDIEQIAHDAADKPSIDKQELLDLLELKTGDVYTKETEARDLYKLTQIYGRRGFPDWESYRSLDRATSFRVDEPDLTVDPETARVWVTYKIHEGKRKRVRDVTIRGNRFTRDHVIRRALSLFPGENLDMEEYRLSLDRLRALKIFGDLASTQPGVQLDLKPVEGQDEFVDLDVRVEEGSTGQILLGAGLSTARGFFGSMTYRKRNFDWSRPPTGFNPLGWFGQILGNEAFHGGGQTLNLDLQPGTEDSFARFMFYEPDLLGWHLDTLGLRLTGFRLLRFFDSYTTDSLGGSIQLDKN